MPKYPTTKPDKSARQSPTNVASRRSRSICDERFIHSTGVSNLSSGPARGSRIRSNTQAMVTSAARRFFELVMPGKRWSFEEKQFLRRQIDAGTPLSELCVSQRTCAGIAYQLRQLDIYPTSRWTKAEVRLLRKQAKEGAPPWKIMIFGRSPNAVRNKMLRLQLWKPKSHAQKPWTLPELNLLQHLVTDCGYTARQAAANGYFTGRSIDSIGQQMRRGGWKRRSAQPQARTGVNSPAVASAR